MKNDMTRDALAKSVEKYQAFDAVEEKHRTATLTLLKSNEECFERWHFPRHMVGGGWLISPDGTKAALMYHKFLDRWVQFGGHADGEVNILNVGLREAQEESGIDDITPVSHEIFDIDVHPIPERPERNEPAHMHYELRYLLRAGNMDLDLIDNGVGELRWFTAAELDGMNLPASIQRMVEKWKKYQALKN